MNRSIWTVCLFTLLSTSASAQDKIYRQNGKIVEARVLEVGPAEIKYRLFTNPEGPIYVLETDRVKKIVYENGTTEDLRPKATDDAERYVNDRKKMLKLNFFSPLYGYTEIGYERVLSPGRSLEFSAGALGLGRQSVIWTDYGTSNLREVKTNQSGAFVAAGYKINKLPDFILFGRTRMSHLMQGTYMKPTFYLGHYSENQVLYKMNNDFEVRKQKITFAALQLEFGKQWIFADLIALNTYWGFGYGADNKKSNYVYENAIYPENYAAWNYVNARAGRSPGLSFTFGLKLGILLD